MPSNAEVHAENKGVSQKAAEQVNRSCKPGWLSQAVCRNLAPGIGKSVGSNGLCQSVCGDSKEKEQQKQYINDQHPLTGDPATDQQIQKNRDDQFAAWQRADDLKKFDNLSPEMKELLPVAKQFVDAIAAKLPPEAMELTLSEAAAKYPDIAADAWGAIQDVFPALAGMPLDYALALAKSSGLGNVKLKEIKARVDNLAAARGTVAASGSSATTALIGIAALAGILGVVGIFRRK